MYRRLSERIQKKKIHQNELELEPEFIEILDHREPSTQPPSPKKARKVRMLNTKSMKIEKSNSKKKTEGKRVGALGRKIKKLDLNSPGMKQEKVAVVPKRPIPARKVNISSNFKKRTNFAGKKASEMEIDKIGENVLTKTRLRSKSTLDENKNFSTDEPPKVMKVEETSSELQESKKILGKEEGLSDKEQIVENEEEFTNNNEDVSTTHKSETIEQADLDNLPQTENLAPKVTDSNGFDESSSFLQYLGIGVAQPADLELNEDSMQPSCSHVAGDANVDQAPPETVAQEPMTFSDSTVADRVNCIKPKFNIRPADRTLNCFPQLSMPDLSQVKSENLKPKNSKKKKKTVARATQTANPQANFIPQVNVQRCMKRAFDHFFSLYNSGIPLANILDYPVPPLAPEEVEIYPRRIKCTKPPVQTSKVQKKSKVPTGTRKQSTEKTKSEDLPSSSFAFHAAGPSGIIKPAVPIGAFESQPLWKKDDVEKLGSFSDRYNFPKKRNYACSPVLLDQEERRMYELNELERQKQEIIALRYGPTEHELFGEISSDNEHSVASTADGNFSDDENEKYDKPKMQQNTASCQTLDEKDILDTISLHASSILSNSPNRMDDFDEPENQSLAENKVVPPTYDISHASVMATNPNFTSSLVSTYLSDLQKYFCQNFFKNAKCGYGCTDLQCYRRMIQTDLELVKHQLKSLQTYEILEIFNFISQYFIVFNHFFPILSGILGSRYLLVELRAAITFCERPKFEISHYKWIVDGFIRAHLSPKDAIETLLKNKNDASVTGNTVVLEIIVRNGLLGEFFDIVLLYLQEPQMLLNFEIAQSIISYSFTSHMPNLSDILRKVVQIMSDEARAAMWALYPECANMMTPYLVSEDEDD